MASGFVVVFGLIAGKRLDGWTAFFLADDGAHERDRLPLPDHPLHSRPGSRDGFAAGAGGRDLRPLR